MSDLYLSSENQRRVNTHSSPAIPVPPLTNETVEFDETLIPIDDMYYSLEYDAEAVEEYDKVQEKLLLEDYDSPGPETPTDTMPVGALWFRGPSNTS